SSAIVRDVIIPEIEKEVNEGKNFSLLRQIYNSIILATWYKQSLKESLLSKIYVDQNKVAGVDVDDKEIKQKIFEQYMVAFRKGVYNLIKEEVDASTQAVLERNYFSGGLKLSVNPRLMERKTSPRNLSPAGRRFMTAQLPQAVQLGKEKRVRIKLMERGEARPQESVDQFDALRGMAVAASLGTLENDLRAVDLPADTRMKIMQEGGAIKAAMARNPGLANNPFEVAALMPETRKALAAQPQLSSRLSAQVRPTVESVNQMDAMRGFGLAASAGTLDRALEGLNIPETPEIRQEAGALQAAIQNNPKIAEQPFEIARIAPQTARAVASQPQLTVRLTEQIRPSEGQSGQLDAMRGFALAAVSGSVGRTLEGLNVPDADAIRQEASAVQTAIRQNPKLAEQPFEIARIAPQAARVLANQPQLTARLTEQIRPTVESVGQLDAMRGFGLAASTGSVERALEGLNLQETAVIRREAVAVQTAIRENPKLAEQPFEIARIAPQTAKAVASQPQLSGRLISQVRPVAEIVNQLDAMRGFGEAARTGSVDRALEGLNLPDSAAIRQEAAAVQIAIRENPKLAEQPFELARIAPQTARAVASRPQLSQRFSEQSQPAVTGEESARFEAVRGFAQVSSAGVFSRMIKDLDLPAQQVETMRQESVSLQEAVRDNPAIASQPFEIARIAPQTVQAISQSPVLANQLRQQVQLSVGRDMQNNALKGFAVLSINSGNIQELSRELNLPADVSANLRKESVTLQRAMQGNPDLGNQPLLMAQIAPETVRVIAVQPRLAERLAQQVQPREDQSRQLQAVSGLAFVSSVGTYNDMVDGAAGELNLSRATTDALKRESAAVQSAVRQNPEVLNQPFQIAQLAPESMRMIASQPRFAARLAQQVNPVEAQATQMEAVRGVTLVSSLGNFDAVVGQNAGDLGISDELRGTMRQESASLQAAIRQNPAIANQPLQIAQIAPETVRAISAQPRLASHLADQVRPSQQSTQQFDAMRGLAMLSVSGSREVDSLVRDMKLSDQDAQTLRRATVALQSAIAQDGRIVREPLRVAEIAQGAAQLLTRQPLLSERLAKRVSAAPQFADRSDRSILRNREPEQVGGIDFNVSTFALQIKRDGKGVPLPVSFQDLDQINIEGLYPVIIDVAPASQDILPTLSRIYEQDSPRGIRQLSSQE
ncbi:MAG: hypothetical protein U1D99_11650, partial [Candidatus Omnitrophota bacterium]|nr:hypothetical protein [Candidatus Omnitrophota bacterium]